jgi:hypothetical protein
MVLVCELHGHAVIYLLLSMSISTTLYSPVLGVSIDVIEPDTSDIEAGHRCCECEDRG